jgi:tRNA(Arg) A34 adenosine deaminase TadA
MDKFMRAAINKAKQGILKGQTPFGACIVKGNKIVSCAHNAVWKDTDISAHAEIRAIKEACGKLKTIDLSGCVIYATCEPCPMCFSACHWSKISRIVYGTTVADAKEIGFNELAIPNDLMKRLGKSPVKIQGGFLREENLELFRLWSKQKGRRAY